VKIFTEPDPGLRAVKIVLALVLGVLDDISMHEEASSWQEIATTCQSSIQDAANLGVAADPAPPRRLRHANRSNTHKEHTP
jgi:hypothetical protein